MQITIEFEGYSEEDIEIIREKIDHITFVEFLSDIYVEEGAEEIVEPLGEEGKDILVTYHKLSD